MKFRTTEVRLLDCIGAPEDGDWRYYVQLRHTYFWGRVVRGWHTVKSTDSLSIAERSFNYHVYRCRYAFTVLKEGMAV